MPGLERTLEMTILIRAINQTTGAFGGVRLAAVAALGATAAALAYSVKQAADFQTGLTQLATGAGESANQLQKVGDGVKQISIDTATSTDQLLKGMFMIDSAGFTAAKGGLTVLKVAAQGARQENADLGQTANALTGLLHDYGLGADHAAAAMNALITTEEHGKMHMQDLTTSLAQVIPISAKLGISFPQIGAAMDIMTNTSMSARQSAQNLNFLIRALATAGSTGPSLSALTEVGLKADQVTNTLRGPNGLYTALTLVVDAISKKFPEGSNAWNVAVKEIMGGAVGWRTAVMLTGKSTQEYANDLKAVSAAMDNTKAGVENWTLTQQTFNFQLDATKQSLQVMAIDVGTVLIPVLERLLAWVTPIVTQFTDWITKSGVLQGAINSVTTFVQQLVQSVTPVVTRFIGWVTTSGDLQNALGAVAGVIGRLVPLAVDLAHGIGNLYEAIKPAATGIVIAITSIYLAVKLLNFAAMVAGWINWINTMRQGAGFIANVANQALPQLSTALGWTRTQADATSAAMTRLGIATTVQVTATQAAAAQTVQAYAQMSASVQAWATEATSASETMIEEKALEAAAIQAAADKEAAAEGAQAVATAAATKAMAEQARASAVIQGQAANILAGSLPAGAAAAEAQTLAMLQQEAIDLQTVADNAQASAVAFQTAAQEARDMAAAAEGAASEAALATKMAVADEVTATEGAVAAEVAASAAASTAITVAMGAATLGISLLIGAAITGMVYAANTGQNAMNQMRSDVKKAYDDLGTSAADTATKAKASQMTIENASNEAAGKSRGYWVSSASQSQVAMDNAKVKMVLDQQAIADAAEKAAKRADDAWVKASQDMNIIALLQTAGWNRAQIRKYLAGTGVNTSDPNPFPSQKHASGIINNPIGHWAMVGERGPELMYVPKGSNIYPHGTVPGGGGNTINVFVSTMAGSRTEVLRMVDLIETELAARFRTQTSSFALAGLT